jgi:hypothetical protein
LLKVAGPAVGPLSGCRPAPATSCSSSPGHPHCMTKWVIDVYVFNAALIIRNLAL